MKSLALVTGRCSGLEFRGIPVEKRSGVWTFKPCRVVSHGVGLLGLDPRTIQVLPQLPNGGFFGHVHVLLRCFPHRVFLFWRWDGSPPPDSLTSSFILACVRCLSSTCRVNLYKTDICPISPIPELLGTVDKAEEYGSVRCRVLSGKSSKDNFPQDILDLLTNLFLYLFFTPPLNGALGLPRTRLSSAVSPGHFCLIFLSSDLNLLRFGPLDSP